MRLIAAIITLLGFIAFDSPVAADVVFDNGAPDFSNAFENGLRVLADDFTLNKATTLTSVRFWSLEWEPSAYNGSTSWWIYSNANGVPGSQLPGFAGSSVAARTYLGQGPNSLAPNEFVYDFGLGSLTPLAPGKYWLVLHNGSLDQSELTGFAWALAPRNSTAVSQQSTVVNGAFGTNISGWLTNSSELAFQLSAPGYSNTTYDPETGHIAGIMNSIYPSPESSSGLSRLSAMPAAFAESIPESSIVPEPSTVSVVSLGIMAIAAIAVLRTKGPIANRD